MARSNQNVYINKGHESVVISSNYESSVKTASQEQCQIYDVLSDSICEEELAYTDKNAVDRKEVINWSRCRQAGLFCAVVFLAATISGTVTYTVTKRKFSQVKSGSDKVYLFDYVVSKQFSTKARFTNYILFFSRSTDISISCPTVPLLKG